MKSIVLIALAAMLTIANTEAHPLARGDFGPGHCESCFEHPAAWFDELE